MNARPASFADLSSVRAAFGDLVTEQLRVVLEQRSVRLGALGVMLVVASWFSLLPAPGGIDSAWMFIVPVAIAAIAAGIKEGLVIAFAASGLCALYAIALTGFFDESVFVGVLLARFVPYGITAAVLGAFAEAHYSVQSNLRYLASIDPLTRVSNVTSFYEQLRALDRTGTDFAVLLADVDDLKALNDLYGHQMGTAAIKTVADVLRRVVRGTDCVARYGGDEFVVILNGADRAGAAIVMNRIREMLAQATLPTAPGVPVTVSIGVAMSGEDGTSVTELLAVADAGMYADKRARKRQRAY